MSEATEVKRVVMCAVALLFQQQVGKGTVQKVRCCFVEHRSGDDEYDHRAKAERYFRNHKEMSGELEGFHVCAWNTAMLNEDT